MTPLLARLRCLSLVIVAIVAIVPVPLTAQTLYAGVGADATIRLNDQPAGVKRTHDGIATIIGLDWPGRIVARLEGTATPYGYLWVAADVTYRLAARSSPLQPYALAGADFRIAVDYADPISTLGVGVRAKLTGLVSAFGESRVLYVITGAPTYSLPPDPQNYQDRTFLFFTLGLPVT